MLGKLDDWEALPKPLTRSVLDGAACPNPGCECKAGETPIVFMPKCHPHAGFNAFYFDGILSLRCDECKDAVSQWEIAKT